LTDAAIDWKCVLADTSRIQTAGAVLTIYQAETPQQIATVRELMLEYAAAMNFSLCFQNFDEELRTLPGKYAPPSGRLLLADWDGQIAGIVGLRAIEDAGVCEMKRLYVRPDFRGKSLGRTLANHVIRQAAEIGYKQMRLDTIQGIMDPAIRLYRELGFHEIPAYYSSLVRETLFMELAL
jgi:GNAT superfamily N-acetyltransferase